MRRILFCVILGASIIGNLCSQDQELKGILEQIEFQNADLGFVAYNIDRDMENVSINPDKKLSPASILKVLSTNVALELLGEDYTFKTGLGFTGEIENGTIGNLIIIGGGDPSIGFDIQSGNSRFSKNFFDWIRAKIEEAGISHIKGDIILEISHFTSQALPDGWIWSDIGNYYGAGSYGFNYLGNRYSLFFNSGKSEGDKTKIEDIFPRIDLNIDNKVISRNIRSDQAYLYGGPYQENILAEGAIPLNQKRFEVKGSLPNPPHTFLEIFKQQLKSWGIELNGDCHIESENKTQYRELGTYHSPELGAIVSYTNRKSDNFFAETILKELGFNFGEGSTKKGLEVIANYFLDNDLGNLEITDASGLSRTNLLSAGQMVSFLKHNMNTQKRNFTSFGLSTAGKSGSLRKLGAGTCFEGKMMGKSGYMKGVRSYTGIYLNEQEERIVYCIILNNHNCSAARARQLIGEVLEKTFCN